MTDATRSVSLAADVARPIGGALRIGAHLVTPRRGYTHHGIYVGENRVVHYSGWSRALLRGPIEEVSLARFADGRDVSIKSYPRTPYSPEEVVARARSRLGEDRYRLTTNNCEHFCEWCLSGQSRSEQVERIVSSVRVAALAATRFLKETFGAVLNTRPRTTGC